MEKSVYSTCSAIQNYVVILCKEKVDDFINTVISGSKTRQDFSRESHYANAETSRYSSFS